MRHHHAFLSLSAAVLVLAIPAASASASTLTLSKACYARVPTKGSEPLGFSISGGVPGGRYVVSAPSGKAGSVSGSFDAAGNASNFISFFSTNGGIDPVKSFKIPLQVQEYGGPYNGNVTGGATATVTNAAMKISNRSASKPYAKRTWVMSGLTPLFGKGTLYASWVKKGGKRVVKTARLGKPSNACGYLRIRRNASPAKHSGHWTIYVHVGKKLDRTKSLAWDWRVRLFRF